jgi:hypothetical protein
VRPLLTAFFLLGLSAPGAVHARGFFQSMCEDKMEPQRVSVSSKLNGYSIDNTLSYKELGARVPAPPPRGTFVLGLTTTRAGSTIEHNSRFLRNPISNYECVSSQIETKLYYEPAVIYIGREFAPGTCAYQEILAHEMRHLNTYFKQLPKVETVVRAALRKRFETRAVYAPKGQVEEFLVAEFSNIWIPYLTKELTRVESLQALIDTPEEYARLSRVCEGAVQSLIQSDAQTRR